MKSKFQSAIDDVSNKFLPFLTQAGSLALFTGALGKMAEAALPDAMKPSGEIFNNILSIGTIATLIGAYGIGVKTNRPIVTTAATLNVLICAFQPREQAALLVLVNCLMSFGYAHTSQREKDGVAADDSRKNLGFCGTTQEIARHHHPLVIAKEAQEIFKAAKSGVFSQCQSMLRPQMYWGRLGNALGEGDFKKILTILTENNPSETFLGRSLVMAVIAAKLLGADTNNPVSFGIATFGSLLSYKALIGWGVADKNQNFIAAGPCLMAGTIGKAVSGDKAWDIPVYIAFSLFSHGCNGDQRILGLKNINEFGASLVKAIKCMSSTTRS